MIHNHSWMQKCVYKILLRKQLKKIEYSGWGLSPQGNHEMILWMQDTTQNGILLSLWNSWHFLTSDFDLECCSVILCFAGVAALVLLCHLLDDELALCPLADNCCPLVLLHLSLILPPHHGPTCSWHLTHQLQAFRRTDWHFWSRFGLVDKSNSFIWSGEEKTSLCLAFICTKLGFRDYWWLFHCHTELMPLWQMVQTPLSFR